MGNNPVNYIDPSGHKMVLLDGGGGSGYLIGRLGAKIGAQSLIGSSAVDGLGETALDALVDGMNGDTITLEKVIKNGLSNIGGNIALGGLFRGIGKIVPSTPRFLGLSDQEVADAFVEGMEDISSTDLTKNFKASGGFSQAVNDFKSLNLKDVKSIKDSKGLPGFRGILPDGTSVVARQTSKEGLPTLEFQFKQSNTGNKVKYEVRYESVD